MPSKLPVRYNIIQFILSGTVVVAAVYLSNMIDQKWAGLILKFSVVGLGFGLDLQTKVSHVAEIVLVQPRSKIIDLGGTCTQRA